MILSSDRNKSRPEVPAKNMQSVLGFGGATLFRFSFPRSLIIICASNENAEIAQYQKHYLSIFIQDGETISSEEHGRQS